MSLFNVLVDLQKDNSKNNLNEKNLTLLDKYLIAISMYIHFYYDTIVSEPQIMEFLVDSERVLNKFHFTFSEYTQRQIESIFIAFNFLLYLNLTNNWASLD
jgi:hypothetical protein